MHLLCKACGKVLDGEDYKESQRLSKTGVGCLFWIVAIVFGIFIVTLPIIILLYRMLKRQQPESVCPYCHAKDSLIPIDTPLAQKMLKENYDDEYIEKIQIKNDIEMSDEEAKENMHKNLMTLLRIFAISFWLLIILCIVLHG